jgi:hypothetical protein
MVSILKMEQVFIFRCRRYSPGGTAGTEIESALLVPVIPVVMMMAVVVVMSRTVIMPWDVMVPWFIMPWCIVMAGPMVPVVVVMPVLPRGMMAMVLCISCSATHEDCHYCNNDELFHIVLRDVFLKYHVVKMENYLTTYNNEYQ